MLVDGRRIRGNERQVLLLVDGLVARGHEVWLPCRSVGPVREAAEQIGVGTTGIRPRGDADLVSALAFAWWLRRRAVDVVLVTSWKRAFTAGWAARLAGVDRVLLRLGGLRGSESGLGARLRRFALHRWYDGYVVNSEGVRSGLVDHFGLEPSKISVVPNGVEAPVEATALAPAPLREELGLPEGALVLVTVSGLERNKGANLLPRILADQESDVHLVVAGRGTEGQREELRTAARALGVGERLHLLGHRDDVAAILEAADAFVLPSRVDSMPNAMLEAMAAGLPIVMSAVGGVESALDPVEGRPAAGWIAPPEDVEAIAAAVREVVEDLRAGGRAAAARGAEAARRAKAWFSTERMVSRYENVLEADVARGEVS